MDIDDAFVIAALVRDPLGSVAPLHTDGRFP
jgi:hypothetical protein